jgi:hypothetical protein
MAKSGLEGDGSPIAGCPLLGFRGRDGNVRLAFSRVWVVQEGTEGPLLGAAQPRQEHHTVLASMSVEGMGPSLAVEGATTARVFETYVERVLAPTLREAQVVVMDNLSAHKGERVRELVEGRGLAAFVPAFLLAGLQPHRGGLQQDKEPDTQSPGA